jgi:alkylation response protein AidB-like acyl-CoA dehydrogenase
VLTDLRARGVFTPGVDSWIRGVDPEFSAILGAQGWIGLTWPVEYGGQGRSYLDRFVVLEELLIAGAPVAAHWFADRQVGPGLLRFGTERQRRELLPRIATGRCLFAIGLSEPDSGSDLASVRARATRVDGGWVVTGTKVWTSLAHLSHYMVALVRTGPDRYAGLSQVIVDLSAPEVTIRPIVTLTGESHFNEVQLDDVFVPDDMVLGEIGQGWRQVNSELAYERSGPERYLSTFQLVLEFAEHVRREPDNRSLAALGGLFAQLRCVRDLSMQVTLALDGERPPDTEAALVKDLGTRLEQQSIEIIRTAVDVLDAGSRLDELLWQATCSAPTFTLRGGTNEVLRVLVSRGLNASSRRDADPVIDNLVSLLDDQENREHPSSLTVADDPTWRLLAESGYLEIDVADGDGDFLTACRVLQACAGSTATAGLPVGNALLVTPWLRRTVGLSADGSPTAVVVDTDLTVTSSTGGATVEGTTAAVSWVRPDTTLLLCARDADGAAVVVEVPAPWPTGLSMTVSTTRGGIVRAAVICEGVQVPAQHTRPITPEQLDELRARVALSVTAQIAGALDRVLAMTVEFAHLRVQFGKSIDQFQMVKSHLAELAAEAGVAAAAAGSAATVLASGPPSDIAQTAVLAARVRAAQAATTATRLAHQVHGAMGITREHPLHVLTGLLWSLRDTGATEAQAQLQLGRRLVAGGADTFLRSLLCGASD